MARTFLSELKTTLDSCINELEEIHYLFCKNPALTLPGAVSSLSKTISGL